MEYDYNEPEPLLTTEDVAKWLNLRPNTVTVKATQGLIPGYKLEGEWRFKRADIEAYLEQRRNTPPPGGTTRSQAKP